MTVEGTGEFGLIQRITQWVQEGASESLLVPRPPAKADLVLGIGDDAAVWRSGETLQVLTTDTMVEDVHFASRDLDWNALGWKALASNLSDVAAMGAAPAYALVTLGMPGNTRVADLHRLYLGMLELANRWNVVVAGGDVVRAPVLFVTITLAGVGRSAIMRRDRAAPSDLVAISGPLGLSGGGLRLVLQGNRGGHDAEALLDAHLRPDPPVALGQRLAELGVEAALDISDGFLDDLGKLCRSSGVAARVHQAQVPVHPSLERLFPGDFWELIYGGGEDYELLFTASPATMERVLAERDEVAVVGEIVAGEAGHVTVVDPQGWERTSLPGGWDHFQP